MDTNGPARVATSVIGFLKRLQLDYFDFRCPRGQCPAARPSVNVVAIAAHWLPSELCQRHGPSRILRSTLLSERPNRFTMEQHYWRSPTFLAYNTLMFRCFLGENDRSIASRPNPLPIRYMACNTLLTSSLDSFSGSTQMGDGTQAKGGIPMKKHFLTAVALAAAFLSSLTRRPPSRPRKLRPKRLRPRRLRPRMD